MYNSIWIEKRGKKQSIYLFILVNKRLSINNKNCPDGLSQMKCWDAEFDEVEMGCTFSIKYFSSKKGARNVDFLNFNL